MSLVYQGPGDSRPRGKTSEDTDTFHGRFVRLVPYDTIVWDVEFESPDPAFTGIMRVTWTLEEAKGGTGVTILIGNIPRGLRPEDNEAGSRLSLQKLVSLVEGHHSPT